MRATRRFYRVLGVGMLALVAGCATQKDYAGTQSTNLVVKIAIDSGAVAALDIHSVESRCKTQYEGRVRFEQAEVRVGLAQEQPLLLSFAFVSNDFWSGSRSTVRHETLFVARQGYIYVAEVSYLRGLYDVTLRETRPGSGSGRVLERRPLLAC